MNGDESMMNCPSSAINGDPVPAKSSGSLAPMFKSLSGGSCYYGSGWDPIVSLNHGETFGGSSNISSHCDFPYPVVMENQGTGNNTSSHLAQYPSSDLNLVQMIPKLPCYESGNYSEMATSFGLPATTSGCPPNYFPNRDGISEKNSIDGFECQEGCQVSEEEAAEGRRRKRSPDSHPSTCHGKKSEREQHKDLSGDELSRENGGKKQKIVQNTVASSNGKQSGKQATENSQSGEDPKASYVHMRARRGQATNSHSLAERVRREKISERMKMLQELVPGCNKITGKAVMLDEIINYVQSLQQQVEFLSMKLATINPELNIDIEQLISKDILHSRGGNSSILGIGPGLGSSHPHSRGFLHGTLPSFHSSGAPMFHPMPQNVWDSELQNLLQMGLISNTSIETLGINGQSKSEV